MSQDQKDIKRLRLQTGMNMTDFAKFFGIPYRTYQNWELGTRKCPAWVVELLEYKLNNEKEKGNL